MRKELQNKTIVFLFSFSFSSIEHGLQSTLAAHPPTINNNNSSINNNNHKTKSGTNSTKLATNDDHHQPLIATIHRNGKTTASAAAVAVANTKAVAVPQIVDLTDGKTVDRFASTMPSKATRNSAQQQKPSVAADLNVIRANKTIVALSILIQHLTTNVSVSSEYVH